MSPIPNTTAIITPPSKNQKPPRYPKKNFSKPFTSPEKVQGSINQADVNFLDPLKGMSSCPPLDDIHLSSSDSGGNPTTINNPVVHEPISLPKIQDEQNKSPPPNFPTVNLASLSPHPQNRIFFKSHSPPYSLNSSRPNLQLSPLKGSPKHLDDICQSLTFDDSPSISKTISTTPIKSIPKPPSSSSSISGPSIPPGFEDFIPPPLKAKHELRRQRQI